MQFQPSSRPLQHPGVGRVPGDLPVLFMVQDALDQPLGVVASFGVVGVSRGQDREGGVPFRL